MHLFYGRSRGRRKFQRGGRIQYIFDPEAAKIVFGSGIPLVMVGLDVTLRAVLSDSDCNGIRGMAQRLPI